jgi:hypothetical protein
MQNNRKILGISLIILGIIIIILIIYFSFFRNKKTAVEPVVIGDGASSTQITNEPTEGTTTPSDIPRNYQKYDISKEAKHAFNASDLSERGQAFAERFGSYTNQSEYGNFSDLRIFMTDNFSDWTVKYVEELKIKGQATSSYSGIVTHALSGEVRSFDDKVGKAEVVIETVRTESAMSGDKEPYLQKIILSFLKVNGEWLVDAAYWEKL